MLEAPFVLPSRGASVVLPAGVSGIVVPAGTQTAEIPFRWPFRTMVRALRVTVPDALPSTLANIQIQIANENQQIITTDGQGYQLQVGPLGLQGFNAGAGWGARSGRSFAMQRLVQSGDIWRFRISNANAFDVTPEIAFYLGELK